MSDPKYPGASFNRPTGPPVDSANPFAPPISVPSATPAQSDSPTASAIDGILPTNPLAAISCYLGIFSLITCFGGVLFGPLAILLGVIGLKTWRLQESKYGKTMSSIRAWIGIVTGALSIPLSIIAIVMAFMNR